MSYIAVTTILHNGKTIEAGSVLPEMKPQELASLVASESAVDEKHKDSLLAVRKQRAAAYAPRLVDDEGNETPDYDPQAAADEIAKKDSKAPVKEEKAEPETKATGGNEEVTAETKALPLMSKATLLKIAEARGVEVDPTLNRNEVYQALESAENK